MGKLVIFIVSSYFMFVSSAFSETAITENVDRQYETGVRDASVAQKNEIEYDLIAIDETNNKLVWNDDKTKLLVVTWKGKKSYEPNLKNETQTSLNEDYVVWVTTVPQVQNFCTNFVKHNPGINSDNLNLCTKQHLGLNYTWQYDVFVEMWVSPDDMFRPCVDPEINDSFCNIEFSDNIPVVKGIKDYRAFYQNLYFSDFRSSPGVPWTGLGYTFDWGSAITEVGASEFILAPGSNYVIKKVWQTEDYCNLQLKGLK